MSRRETAVGWIMLTVAVATMDGARGQCDMAGNGTKEYTLRFMSLLPIGYPSGEFRAPAIRCAMEIARDDINNRTDILPHYRIVIIFQAAGCTTNTVINTAYRSLYRNTTKQAILGPLCSAACTSLGEAITPWNIPMVTYSCGTPALSNKAIYPNAFRTFPPDTSLVPIQMLIMQYFGWSRISSITIVNDLYSALNTFLTTNVLTYNFTLLDSELYITASDPTNNILMLQQRDARIIAIYMEQGSAVRVLCKAYQMGLYGPRFVYFLLGFYSSISWSQSTNFSDCTPDQIMQTIDGSFYIGVAKNIDNQVSVSGRTVEGFWHEFIKRIGPDLVNTTYVHPLTSYDSVWMTALALDRAEKTFIANGCNKTLRDFTYTDPDLGPEVIRSFYKLNYIGIQGKTVLNANGDPIMTMQIDQQQGKERVPVAYVQPPTSGSWKGTTIEWVNGGPIWRAGYVPHDAPVVVRKHVYLLTNLYGAMVGLSVLGTLYTLALLLFNFIFREKRTLKMSSPNINNIMLLGCLLVYATQCCQQIDTINLSYATLCELRVFFFVVGFSLVFGAMFAKTWRVHVIFTRSLKSTRRVRIRDSQLLLVVVGIVLVNVFVLALWKGVDPLTSSFTDVSRTVDPRDTDVTYVNQVITCSSAYALYFNAAMYIIQGVLLSFGAFLAWETRKIKLEALNDSRQIGVCIYTVLILGCFGIAVTVAVQDINAYYALISIIIVGGTVAVQAVIFYPKIVGVLKNEVTVGTSFEGDQKTSVGDDSSHPDDNKTIHIDAPHSRTRQRFKLPPHDGSTHGETAAEGNASTSAPQSTT